MCSAEAAHGVLFAPVPVDLDEERNLDGQFQPDFPLAEVVTDHLAESAEPTAGGGEELSELLHDADIVGIGRMTDKVGRT